MKNGSRWSLCFRPPATIEIDDGVDCSADRMISLIAAARNSNRLKNKRKKQEKKKSPQPMSKVLESSVPVRHQPLLRRSFSSVVKSVVFETSLSRRVRESKLSRNRSDHSSLRAPPSEEEALATADRTVSDKKPKSKSKSTMATDFGSENRIESEIGGGSAVRLKMNPVVCLMLLSLLVTVFCGRALAVITTTIAIYAWQSGVVVVGLGEMARLKEQQPWKKLRW